MKVRCTKHRLVFCYDCVSCPQCLLVCVSALHVVARVVLKAHDADAAGPAAYYTHLIFDVSTPL